VDQGVNYCQEFSIRTKTRFESEIRDPLQVRWSDALKID